MKKQAWVAVTLLISLVLSVSFALADKTVYVDPESTDVQQQAAVQLAKKTLCEHFENMEALLDASAAAASFGYLDADVDEPLWMIEFTNPDTDNGSYIVEIARDGAVLNYNAPYEKPFRAGEDEMTGVTLAEPGKNDATKQQAISNAKAALNEIGDYETRMDQLTAKAYFLYGDRYNNGYEPVWLLYFYQGDVLQQKVLLGYDGSYIQTVSAGKQFTITNHSEDGFGVRFADLNFYRMTIEEKAAFSQKWIPIVNQYIKTHPYYPNKNDLFYQATRIVFGVPGADDLSQEEAMEIATEAIIPLGANPSTIDQRMIGYSFDITDPEHPIWALAFYPAVVDDHAENLLPENFHTYLVLLDAKTGAVLDSLDDTGVADPVGFYY